MKKKAADARSMLPDDERRKALKSDFDDAHQAGKKALKNRDFNELAKVIEREREIIEQQRARLDKRSRTIRKG